MIQEQPSKIRGKDIKRLVSKFKYKNGKMHFEIYLLLRNTSELKLFYQTLDYKMFHNKMDDLLEVQIKNKEISMQEI